MSDTKKTVFVDSVDAPTIQEVQDLYNAMTIQKSASPIITSDLIKSAMGAIQAGSKTPRLAFTENPNKHYNYTGVFKYKSDLLPAGVIKQIRVRNLLIAAIVRTRGNQMSMFGHLRNNRFDIGLEVKIKKALKDSIEPEELVMIKKRIDSFTKILMDCGKTNNLGDKEKLSFSEFLSVQAQNGVSFGWFGTELIWEDVDQTRLHRFRPVDAGTIHHALSNPISAKGVRAGSVNQLQTQERIKINKEILGKEHFDYVQVIDGLPKQAFTTQELIMYNLYPSTDLEHNGYPVTPLDTAVNAVTTHSSIEIYNKLYFQNGKSSKGILVINSDSIDQNTIADMKQQFNASINNVNNSFKIPIFGVGKEENVQWLSTMPNRKDGEFEYLYDQNTRNILAAFNMSPDELPGFAHLSRGTSQQSLSESNTEFKLTAQRDSGIRPLILKFQDFLNEKLFPLLDPELAQLCDIQFSGLDAETRQQENNLLQAEMPIHMTYDEVMDVVDKDTIGAELGGAVPFNERYRTILDAYNSVGEIRSAFFNDSSAMTDSLLKYRRDPFFFQNMQFIGSVNPVAVQAFYAPKPYSFDLLKMNVQDMFDEEDSEE